MSSFVHPGGCVQICVDDWGSRKGKTKQTIFQMNHWSVKTVRQMTCPGEVRSNTFFSTKNAVNLLATEIASRGYEKHNLLKVRAYTRLKKFWLIGTYEEILGASYRGCCRSCKENEEEEIMNHILCNFLRLTVLSFELSWPYSLIRSNWENEVYDKIKVVRLQCAHQLLSL